MTVQVCADRERVNAEVAGGSVALAREHDDTSPSSFVEGLVTGGVARCRQQLDVSQDLRRPVEPLEVGTLHELWQRVVDQRACLRQLSRLYEDRTVG